MLLIGCAGGRISCNFSRSRPSCERIGSGYRIRWRRAMDVPNHRICLWYFPVVRGLSMADLFMDPAKPSLETAYLIWVSDFSAQILDPGVPGTSFTRALIPAGTATIYFTDTPLKRSWHDPKERSTWGEPVATFVRGESLLQSPDGFNSDSFIFSAKLLSSKTFVLRGKTYNFRRLIPQGMTCFESGLKSSTSESGSCVAIDPGFWF